MHYVSGYDLIDLWVSIEQILTPTEFKIFVMRYKYKMTQTQIAEKYKISHQAVCKRLQKVNKKLKFGLQ